MRLVIARVRRHITSSSWNCRRMPTLNGRRSEKPRRSSQASEFAGESKPNSRVKTSKARGPRQAAGGNVECPLLAQSRHPEKTQSMSLLGVKRTCRFALHMSAFDPKRTLGVFALPYPQRANLKLVPIPRQGATQAQPKTGCHVMVKLYDSAFSPFARKVRMTLEHKELAYEAVDGLLKSNHEALKAVNGRVEVPALVDGDIVVVNSADIVAYLDYRYPAKCVYPDDPAARVHARAWERVADTFVDPILADISYWKWAERPDKAPDGLLEAARADLRIVYDTLNKELAAREFVSGPLSIADIALFPHIASARAMEVEFSAQDHPNVGR